MIKINLTAGLLQSLLGIMVFVAGTSAYQSGCSSRKKVEVGLPQPATDLRTPAYLLKKADVLEKAMKNVQTMSAKARISAEGDGMSIAVNANLLWIRDSIIWLNAKKFGIEAVRALVTKDSVFVLNRLESSVTAASLESLRRQYNLPEGNVFGMLQNTLLGLGIFPDAGTPRADISEAKHRLMSENGQISAVHSIEEGSFLVLSETFLSKRDNNSVSLSFNRHQKIKESIVPFPYLREVNTYSLDSGNQAAEVEFQDVKFNIPVNFRFEVPSHYEKK